MRVVVLAAMNIEQWKEQGRKEQLKLEEQAYSKFCVEVNGVLMLPKTPEVDRFLAGESER